MFTRPVHGLRRWTIVGAVVASTAVAGCGAVMPHQIAIGANQAIGSWLINTVVLGIGTAVVTGAISDVVNGFQDRVSTQTGVLANATQSLQAQLDGLLAQVGLPDAPPDLGSRIAGIYQLLQRVQGLVARLQSVSERLAGIGNGIGNGDRPNLNPIEMLFGLGQGEATGTADVGALGAELAALEQEIAGLNLPGRR